MTDFSAESLKKMAADKAAEFVVSGMFVGLGTGSTAKYVVENLGEKVESGELEMKATPTSIATKTLAESFGIEMIELDKIEIGDLDLVIDGADQIDLVSGICIKGGGGAHYWEKMVAERSKKMIVIVDESKIVDDFKGFKVPVEVEVEKKDSVFAELGGSFREVLSDYGNAILDVEYDGVLSPAEHEEFLMNVDGVVETGWFISLVDTVIVARASGVVEVVDIDYE
jgi:ribose 5-phosphate isomerase A